MDQSFWQTALDADGALPEGYTVAELTPELLGYLGSTDPVLRDDLAYPLLDTWVHSGHYTPAELVAMAEHLQEGMRAGISEQGDDGVFLRTFSALVLAEIVGEDNLHPFLSAEQVRRILDSAIAYLAHERDLRGFVPEKGWAHGVAHVADLLWVLGYSRHLGAPEHGQILRAILGRLHAADGHIFLFSEERRLATTAIGVIGRGLLAGAAVDEWLAELLAPNGEPLGFGAMSAPLSLATFHNVRAFLIAVYFQLAHPPAEAWPGLPAYLGAQFVSPPPSAAALLPAIVAALRTMRGI